MPDDNDRLNNEAMGGGQAGSTQVLSNHVGIGSFIEYLLAASLTIAVTTTVVTEAKANSRSGV